MDRGSEDVPILEHHRSEVTADADGDGLPFDLELGMDPNVVLHAATGVDGVVRGGERGHDLVADGLDDRAVILLGGRPHDLHAGQDHVPGAKVAHDFVDSRAADHIGKQDG
jgi:hypothetical protein